MSNTFTAQDMQNYADYVAKAALSNITPNLDRWYAEWHKPTKKVIDLSVLIDSQIDCEFKDSCDKKWHVSKADKGLYQESLYGTELGDYFEQCRPRIDHKHVWLGGECPLPEGFMFKVWFRNGTYDDHECLASEMAWLHDNTSSDIIAFEVLGLADGYVMPWEQDND